MSIASLAHNEGKCHCPGHGMEHGDVEIYGGGKFESATGSVGSKDCAAKLDLAVPEPVFSPISYGRAALLEGSLVVDIIIIVGIASADRSRALRGGISKMRKSSWIVLTLLLVAIAAPNAQAQTYDVTFMCTDITCGSPDPTAPAVTFPTPTTIHITYEGQIVPVITLTNPLDNPSTDKFGWSAETVQVSGSNVYQFSFLDSTTDDGQNALVPLAWINQENGTAMLIPTPEPSSLTLVMAGVVGLLFVMRKRIGQGLPQAR